MKVEVHLLGGLRKIIDIDPYATRGAVVGKNLFFDDGTIVTRADFGGGSAPDDGTAITSWELILNIPPNVVALAATETIGVYVVTGSGSSATRSMDDSSTIEWVNGSGVAGNPSPSLKELPDTGIGAALVKLTRDAYGRVEGTEAATTDDLTEGTTNLYFTNARVDTRVQAADYTLAGAWNFQHNITVAGMTVGLGPLGTAPNPTNLAIGTGALSSRTSALNTLAIGSGALSKVTTQHNNLALGAGAGSSLTGIGAAANTLIGTNAAGLSVSMSGGTVIGENAARDINTTVVALGRQAMGGATGNATGSTAIGDNSLYSFTGVSQFCTAVGWSSARNKISGNGSTYIGAQAGVTDVAANAETAGSNNTYVGYNSGPGTPASVSYAAAIGSHAKVTTSNTVVLGRTTDNTVIGATGDDGSGAKLQVTGAIKATSEYRVGANKVLGARDTGWTTLAGTATKGGGTTYAAPTISNPPTQAEVQAMADALQSAHRTIKALTDALTVHGIIGA